MRSLLLVIMSVLFWTSICSADESFKFLFVKDFIRALYYHQDISDRTKQMEDDDSMVELLTKIRRDVNNAVQATTLMAAYLEEPKKDMFSNEEEKDAVLNIASIFLNLQNHYISFLKEFKKLSDSEFDVLEGGEEAVPEGYDTMKNVQFNVANINAEKQEDYRRLYFASTLVCHMLLEYGSESNSKGSLAMTLEEKNILLSELKLVYGDQIEEGIKSGESYLLGAGVGLYQTLTQEWPTRDKVPRLAT